jgi:hypothetical protein
MTQNKLYLYIKIDEKRTDNSLYVYMFERKTSFLLKTEISVTIHKLFKEQLC